MAGTPPPETPGGIATVTTSNKHWVLRVKAIPLPPPVIEFLEANATFMRDIQTLGCSSRPLFVV
jgi:hypothetical protein